MKLTRDQPSESSPALKPDALTPEWYRESHLPTDIPPRSASAHLNVLERDAWQLGQNRAGPWVRLRDSTRARAVSRDLGEVTLAELLGTDEDERIADERPWVRA